MDRPATIASALGLGVGLLMLFTAYTISTSVGVPAHSAPGLILSVMACMGLSTIVGVANGTRASVPLSMPPGV